jgi:hypothetical protein
VTILYKTKKSTGKPPCRVSLVYLNTKLRKIEWREFNTAVISVELLKLKVKEGVYVFTYGLYVAA